MPFLRDLSYGFRLLRRSPAFYLLGVLIISLGVGATTAIFSLINGVLLNALPYRDSGRLTVIWFRTNAPVSRARSGSRSGESLAAAIFGSPSSS